MIIIKTKNKLRSRIAEYKQDGEAINFVPTMGNLHQGHIELVNMANSFSGKTVVSIFVNPMQFNNSDDLSRYPRTLDVDIKQLELAGVDLVFAPDVESIYPLSSPEQTRTRVVVPKISELLEGKSRPGHFDGVTTVVTKLFNLVQAEHAIFGEKDFQQLALIKKMVLDLDMSVQIHGHPIIREADGLAMSSRNNNLTDRQRQQAPYLYQALKKLQAYIQQQQFEKEKTNYVKLQQQVINWLDSFGFITDYLLVADADTLLQADKNTSRRIILAATVLGEIRLLDNIYLG
ncbi:MAG: pantoate--beta-alanine ligase [Pseudomonadota bacterium]